MSVSTRRRSDGGATVTAEAATAATAATLRFPHTRIFSYGLDFSLGAKSINAARAVCFNVWIAFTHHPLFHCFYLLRSLLSSLCPLLFVLKQNTKYQIKYFLRVEWHLRSPSRDVKLNSCIRTR